VVSLGGMQAAVRANRSYTSNPGAGNFGDGHVR
jgi:hypothetical protein